jgi:hypothetical protein
MSTIRADNIGPSDGGTTTDLLNGISKHSINFNATTNVVNDSYNNSSLTDNGTGDFTYNFTNNLNDTYYRQYGSSSYLSNSWAIWTHMHKIGLLPNSYKTTSALRVDIVYVASGNNRTNFDFDFNNSDIFGDLA